MSRFVSDQSLVPPRAAAAIATVTAVMVGAFTLARADGPIGGPPPAAPGPAITVPLTQPAAAPAADRAGGPATAPAADVDALVARLGRGSWRDRDQAGDALYRIGEPARDALRRAAESGDPEAAGNARLVLGRLDAHTRATPVTLRLDNVPLADALSALSEQTGVPFLVYQHEALQRLRGTTISLNARNEPFWRVLLKICEAAALRPDCIVPATGALALREDGGAWAEPYVTVHGPFAVRASGVHSYSRATPGSPGGPVGRTFLSLVAHPEPRLRLLYWSALDVSECVDDTGRDLRAKGMPQPDPPASGYVTGSIDLSAAADPSPRAIARLKAVATFAVSILDEQVEVTDVLRARRVARTLGREDGPLRLEVLDCRLARERSYAVRVAVHRDGRDAARWDAAVKQLAASRASLTDAQDRSMRTHGSARVHRDESGAAACTLEYWFDASINEGRGRPGDPVRFVLSAPLRVRDVRVPFELKDVPLR